MLLILAYFTIRISFAFFIHLRNAVAFAYDDALPPRSPGQDLQAGDGQHPDPSPHLVLVVQSIRKIVQVSRKKYHDLIRSM